MKPNEVIQIRREALGLKLEDVAATAALGVSAYWDIELHEDEAYSVANLSHLRAILKLLGLDMLPLFDIDCEFCKNQGLRLDLFDVPRSDLVTRRRVELGLTREQLGDLVGFEIIAIEWMEQGSDFLESWSIELIQDLANALSLPVHALLRAPCSKCGYGQE
jgi:transcriptional regulator with XRE-family HTH domain